MIRVSNPHIETHIILEEKSPVVLTVENPNEYYRTVNALSSAFNDEESQFTFWDGENELVPSKCGELILSPFFFDAADKKTVNLLLKKLENNYHDGDFIVKYNAIVAHIEEFLYGLCSTVDFQIEFNEIALPELLKVCGIKPSKNYDCLLEKLICYINVYAKLKSVSFFVIVGIKSVLSNEELQCLYKHCELEKISLLLIESAEKSRVKNERMITITDDLCEIVANIEEV